MSFRRPFVLEMAIRRNQQPVGYNLDREPLVYDPSTQTGNQSIDRNSYCPSDASTRTGVFDHDADQKQDD